MNSGLTNGIINSIKANSTGQIFISISNAGIYRSSDNGDNWTQINSGLTNTDVLSLEIDSDNILSVSYTHLTLPTNDLV
mgnify:CR=1 FL=1